MNAPFKTPDPLEAPLWDLTDLYASREDPRIEVDLERTRWLVSRLNALEGQLLAARADAALLGERLDRAAVASETFGSAKA